LSKRNRNDLKPGSRTRTFLPQAADMTPRFKGGKSIGYKRTGGGKTGGFEKTMREKEAGKKSISIFS